MFLSLNLQVFQLLNLFQSAVNKKVINSYTLTQNRRLFVSEHTLSSICIWRYVTNCLATVSSQSIKLSSCLLAGVGNEILICAGCLFSTLVVTMKRVIIYGPALAALMKEGSSYKHHVSICQWGDGYFYTKALLYNSWLTLLILDNDLIYPNFNNVHNHYWKRDELWFLLETKIGVTNWKVQYHRSMFILKRSNEKIHCIQNVFQYQTIQNFKQIFF